MHWVSGQPFFVALFCLPAGLLLHWSLYRRRPAAFQLSLPAWFLWLSGLIVVCATAGPLLTAATGRMLYHDEPTILAVAAAELHGEPLYHPPAAAARYSLLYGPATYWVYMPPIFMGAKDVRVFQLWVMLPLLLSFVFVWKLLRATLSISDSVLLLACLAVAVIAQSPNEWAMKGDVWILLATCLALWASTQGSGFSSVLIVGFSGALLFDLKITTGVPLVVPLILLKERLGPQRAWFALIVAAAVALAVFVIPGVSLPNYWFWLHASTAHGLAPLQLLENTLFMAFLSMPPVTIYSIAFAMDPDRTRQWLRSHRSLIIAITVSSLIACITGSKIGAGAWHCMPLAPIMIYVASDCLVLVRSIEAVSQRPTPRSASLLGLWLCLSLLVVAAKVSLWTVKLHWHGGSMASPVSPAAAADDLNAIIRTNPGHTIQMGYGDNASYDLTFQRPLLVLNRNPYSLDADALAEMDLAGMPLPAATIDAITSCSVDVWLVPHGAEPFSMASYYFLSGNTRQRDVFPQQFRQAFLSSYRRSSQSRFYDSWTCSHPDG